MSITEFLLARIAEDEAVASEATPGPWKPDVEVRGDCVVWGPNGEFLLNQQAAPHWTPDANGKQRMVAFDVDRRDCLHIGRFDPARVLAECAAKRAIVVSYTSCERATESTDTVADFGVKLTAAGMAKGMDLALRALAAVYAGHEDYRQEWAL